MNNMVYTDKLVKESRMVAVKAHSSQNYDGIFPYEKHLDDVAEVVKNFGFGNKHLVASYLHDVMEDGALSYNKIKDYFGYEVAEMVFAVTDELGRNRDERKMKTYNKIKNNSDSLIIKLADRIANVEHGGKVSMYRKEHGKFKETLYNGDVRIDGMWEHLDTLFGNDKI